MSTSNTEGLAALVDSDPALFDVQTSARGPGGALPLTEELLREAPSGDLFGWTQDVGMGWNPVELNRREFLLLSTSGGIRNADGTPVALGYHTGHWEVGLLMKAAAEELRALGCIPFAGFCTDPCDGRTQGTPGMMDSLPYRNDAATVLRRLIRSLEVLGEKAYPTLQDVPVRIDLVDIFRKPDAVPELVDAAIAVGARAVWMQEGVVHNAAADKARAAGLQVVMNKCILKEHRAMT